jgi:hypothetical protein
MPRALDWSSSRSRSPSVGWGRRASAFVDYAVLRKPLGLPAQPLDGARAWEITRAHLTAFVDRHLLGRRTPVEDYPEVTDHSRTKPRKGR